MLRRPPLKIEAPNELAQLRKAIERLSKQLEARDVGGDQGVRRSLAGVKAQLGRIEGLVKGGARIKKGRELMSGPDIEQARSFFRAKP